MRWLFAPVTVEIPRLPKWILVTVVAGGMIVAVARVAEGITWLVGR